MELLAADSAGEPPPPPPQQHHNRLEQFARPFTKDPLAATSSGPRAQLGPEPFELECARYESRFHHQLGSKRAGKLFQMFPMQTRPARNSIFSVGAHVVVVIAAAPVSPPLRPAAVVVVVVVETGGFRPAPGNGEIVRRRPSSAAGSKRGAVQCRQSWPLGAGQWRQSAGRPAERAAAAATAAQSGASNAQPANWAPALRARRARRRCKRRQARNRRKLAATL